MPEKSETIRAAILAAQQKGDHLKEYDLAQEGLRFASGDEFFKYSSVLALSRCNAKQRALDTFYKFRLHESRNEYVRALEPRMLKDLAFQEVDVTRPKPFEGLPVERFHTAAVTYQKAYNQFGGHYSAINAATLYMFSGDTASARALAAVSIEQANKDTGPRFFPLATLSEAYLLLDKPMRAGETIREAAGYNRDNLLTRARMNRQLRLVCSYMDIDPKIIDPMLPETVLHYCGHIFDTHRPLGAAAEAELQQRVAKVLADNRCVIAYGSLAAGSDILFAETVLAQGGELNVWLPFAADAFCDVSVRPAGEQWVARFHRCIERANLVSFATESDFLGEDSLFQYCAQIAMGMAVMRAGSLQAKVMQVAIWDGVVSDQQSSTYSNISKWRSMGHHAQAMAIDQFAAMPGGASEHDPCNQHGQDERPFGRSIKLVAPDIPARYHRNHSECGQCPGAVRQHGGMSGLIMVHAVERKPAEQGGWQSGQRCQPQRGMGQDGAGMGIIRFALQRHCSQVEEGRHA